VGGAALPPPGARPSALRAFPRLSGAERGNAAPRPLAPSPKALILTHISWLQIGMGRPASAGSGAAGRPGLPAAAGSLLGVARRRAPTNMKLMNLGKAKPKAGEGERGPRATGSRKLDTVGGPPLPRSGRGSSRGMPEQATRGRRLDSHPVSDFASRSRVIQFSPGERQTGGQAQCRREASATAEEARRRERLPQRGDIGKLNDPTSRIEVSAAPC
jgi:hypothetical protein